MDFSDRAPLSLDRDRVTCLLLINTHLIKKCCNIYNTMLNNQQLMQQRTPEHRAMLSNVYNNYIRRLQCNLATLNYLYEKYHSTQHLPVAAKASFPMILSAPPDMPELNQLYSKLQELYPEAVQYFKIKFEESRKQQAFPAPQQNQPPPQQHSLHQQLPPQPQPQSQPSLQQQQGLQLPSNVPSQPVQQQSFRQLSTGSESGPQIIPQRAPPPPQQQQPPPIPPQQQLQQQFQQQLQQQQLPQQPQQLQQPQQPQQSQSFDDLLLTDGFNPSSDSLGGTGPGDFNPNYNNGSFQLSTLSPQQILQQANENTPISQDFLF